MFGWYFQKYLHTNFNIFHFFLIGKKYRSLMCTSQTCLLQSNTLCISLTNWFKVFILKFKVARETRVLHYDHTKHQMNSSLCYYDLVGYKQVLLNTSTYPKNVSIFQCTLWACLQDSYWLSSFVHLSQHDMGPSIVKWTKQMLRYMKAMVFLVKGPKVVAKCCLKLIIFRDGLYS